MDDVILGVSDFVALLNQTLEFAYPSVTIQGELTNFRVSKNRWVYFDLKDEFSSVKFFGTVYQLPGPLEDGLMVQVRGVPRLHQLYGFSVNVQAMQPVGEGSIKKAAALLEAKLAKEGLFDEDRKRTLRFPPKKIGLVTSSESAAYHDFMKILNARWGGMDVLLADVQVQGEAALQQIVRAFEYLNVHEELDVIVLTRGGGSAEDLAAFSTEQVTRAVAGSRTPTLVAIGHEVDVSLAELAADQRASTPSNAAELLVPDRKEVIARINSDAKQQARILDAKFSEAYQTLQASKESMQAYWQQLLSSTRRKVTMQYSVLKAYDPTAALKRGYAVVKKQTKLITSVKQLAKGDTIELKMRDGIATSTISSIRENS